MKNLIIGASLSFGLLSQVALAKNYIVLFKEAETSISSLQHGDFQSLLQR